MKIDKLLIDKIFDLKIKIKNKKDKIKLSKYEEYIPMYDIYSQRIYPIYKLNLYYRLIDCHYRFVNDQIIFWQQKLFEKYKYDIYKYNLEIIDNYDINTLIDTSYKTLYKYSEALGLLVTICKRNSFNPFISYLVPYYSKLEVIKLGQNMNLLENIDIELDYNLCKTISNNDVSFDEIAKHSNYIIQNNLTSWICLYSFFGSFLFNNYLRNDDLENIPFHPIFLKGILKIMKCMKNTPELNNDYYMYRFIWNDDFLINLQINDIFIDNGFISSTRDPFYSPGLSGCFGLVLIKIKIPKNKKGIGLLIENFSLFPKEEEFLIQPYSKLKLLSKNDNFKYYHTNPEFEKIINRKYEFELIDNDIEAINKLFLILSRNNLSIENTYDITEINLTGIDRFHIIKRFIENYSNNNKVDLKFKNKIYLFNYQWFDATKNSSYEKLYYNKVKDGMMFSLFDDSGYPYLNIELGDKLVINYLNKFYFTNQKYEINKELLDLIYHFGRIFNYSDAIIYHNFCSFYIFEKNYSEEHKLLLSFNLFNYSIYNYLKSNKKFLDIDPFINYKLGYFYLDNYFNKIIDDKIKIKLPNDFKLLKTNRELFINLIEYHFDLYSKIIELIDNRIFYDSYVTFNIYEKLLSENLIENFKPNLDHSIDDIKDFNYQLVYRQPIRRK
jgi:hypothetical protein